MNRRLILLLVLAAAVVAAAVLLPVQSLLGAALAWTAEHRQSAWLAYILLYIVATVCFVPGVPLTVAAGAMFGVTAGTALVSIGIKVAVWLHFMCTLHNKEGNIWPNIENKITRRLIVICRPLQRK